MDLKIVSSSLAYEKDRLRNELRIELSENITYIFDLFAIKRMFHYDKVIMLFFDKPLFQIYNKVIFLRRKSESTL